MNLRLLGRWIVGIELLILAGIALVAYFLLLNPLQKSKANDALANIADTSETFLKGGIAAIKSGDNVTSESICGDNFCINVSRIRGGE